MNYCLRIWGTTNATMLSNVQKLQNFAARVAVGDVRKYDHITPAFTQLNWLKMKQKLYYDIAIMVFKVRNNYYPNWFLTLPTVGEISNSRTRQINNLFVPRTYTECGARALPVLGPNTWNDLPNDVKEANSISIFKHKLKQYLQHNPSYS